MTERAELERVIARSLEFRWHHGACTAIGSHTTGWRDSPHAGMVQIHDLRTRLELPHRQPQWTEPGEAMLIDVDVHHCLTSEQVGPRPLCRWASCDWLVLGGISAPSLFDLPIIQRGGIADRIGDACERLAALITAGKPADPIRAAVEATAIGMTVLAALIDGRPLRAHALQLVAHADRLQPVLAHIDAHLGDPIDRAALARLAHLAPSRFHDLFLRVMRQPPMAYVMRRRMQRAQQLLLTTAQPIQDIARGLAFDDPFHFSRAFRRAIGESPREYRQQGRRWMVPGPAPAS